MRVLFSCGDFFPNLGGVTSLVDDLTRMLRRSGHEVSVLTRRWPGMVAKEVHNGYEILRLDYPVLFEDVEWNLGLLTRSPGILRSLYRLLRERRIEVVCIGLLDTSAFYLLLLKLILRFKVVLYLHGSDTRVLPRTFPNYRRVLQWALTSAEVILPVSEELGREAAVFAPSAAPKMQVTPNGIDVQALLATLAFEWPRPYVAFVGRLVREKDVDTLIEAFDAAAPALGDVDLLIAGKGREGDRLAAKARGLASANRIHFLGLLPREQCWSVIRGSQLVALPSRTEGHPIVALEARVAGKPLLGSDIPGIARVIEHGRTGMLFPQGDVAALADLFRTYLTDARALAELTAGADAADKSAWGLGTELEDVLLSLR